MPLNSENQQNLADDKLRLVDVGGAGGIQEKWAKVSDLIIPTVFEPNPSQAEETRNLLQQTFPDGVVLTNALFNNIGAKSLNLAYYWGCTSLRKPNSNLLSRYRIGKLFDVVGSASVDCTRYDVLHKEGVALIPDVIKIDVQGCEYEVLQGFGDLLHDCLAIELETHLYPIYVGQKLFGDIVSYLADFGFVLRRINPSPSFDTDIVEVDAFFTKHIDFWKGLSSVKKAKFKLFCEVCDVVDYSRINPEGGAHDVDPL